MKFLITILLLLSSLYAWAGERWYADPNIGVAGGVPHDLSKWKRALSASNNVVEVDFRQNG